MSPIKYFTKIDIVKHVKPSGRLLSECSAGEKRLKLKQVVYNHWTSGLDWWTGPVDRHFLVPEITLCYQLRPDSPVGLAMIHFSLYKPVHTLFSV